MTENVIILAPGSRARLIVNQSRLGEDLTLCDVANSMHVINDDGSEGAMNLKPQYLIFHWFFNESMMRDYFKGLVKEAIEEERAALAKIMEDQAEEFERLGSRYAGENGQSLIVRQYAADASTARWLADKIRMRSAEPDSG